MLNPALRIRIASSIPAHLNCLHTSNESKLVAENSEFGFIHLIYRGADFFKTAINVLSCVRN